MDEFGVRIGKYFSCNRSATETELVHKLCEERETQIVTVYFFTDFNFPLPSSFKAPYMGKENYQ